MQEENFLLRRLPHCTDKCVRCPTGNTGAQTPGGDAEWDAATHELVWRVPLLSPGQKVLRSASVSLKSPPETTLPKSNAVVSYQSKGFLYSGAKVAGSVGAMGANSGGSDVQSLLHVVGHITFMPQQQ